MRLLIPRPYYFAAGVIVGVMASQGSITMDSLRSMLPGGALDLLLAWIR